MKTKLTRILGVAMTVALLIGLFVTAAPLGAGAQSWSKFGVPTTTGMVLDTSTATGPMAMASDGSTIYAGSNSGETAGFTLNWDPNASSAVWSVSDKHSGTQSVFLTEANGEYAELYFTVNIRLGDISLASTYFWVKSITGDYIPYFKFEMPSLGQFGVGLNNDMALDDDFSSWAKYDPSAGPDAWQNYDMDTYNRDWDGTGPLGWSTWAEAVAYYGADTLVTDIVVVLSNNPSGAESYVDDVTVNGVTYGSVGSMIKSTDFGATWAAVTTFPSITGPTLTDIVVSSIDPLQVYATDGVDIFKTSDGGTTWVTLSALGAVGTGSIVSIDVGYIGSNAYIFAGTSTFGGGGGSVYVAQEAVFGMPWTDMLVGTDRGTSIGTDTDVTTVLVDPANFGTSQMVLAIVTDVSTGDTFVTTKYSGAQWGATIADVNIVTGGDNLYSSSVWLPDDFSSSLASGTMQLFVGVNSMTASEGDVFWVVFGSPTSASFDLNVSGAGGFGVSSLDGIGTGGSAQMLASGFAAGTPGTPVVLSSSIGGAIWTANIKGPSGGVSPLGTGSAISQVLIDPVTGNAIVATHGINSAVSASSDWAVWNGISLINTTITAITDLFVDSAFVAMVTNNGGGNVDSLWVRATGSTSWLRILDSTTSGWRFNEYQYAGGAGFLNLTTDTAIYRTLNGGATWTVLVSAAPDLVAVWQVVDANTIMVGGDADGEIHQTTNGGVIWFNRTANAVGATVTLGVVVDFDVDSATGDILAVSATTAAISSDNGTTWATNTTATLGVAMTAGTFGASYATTGEYFGTGTGIFKSSGGKWTKIDATGTLVLLGNGIVSGPGVVDLVYASTTTTAAGAVRVKSNRTVGEPMAGAASTVSTGLWSADSNVLWTIRTGGTGDPNIYTWTDTMNVAGSGVTATATGTTTATITWTAQADAGAYTVIVNPTAQTNIYTAASTNPAGSTPAAPTVTTTNSTQTSLITGLIAGVEYKVSVWARDGSGNAISGFLFDGAATSFTTNLGPPVTPTSLAPAAGAANVPVMPTFQWNPPGAGATPTGYLLEVSTVSDFATTILSVALPSAETYYAWQGSALDYGTVYYWRVTASGVSSSVPVASVFTTEAEPVDPVDVITPTTPDITLTVPAAETPAYIWAIIAVGFVLTVAVIILIVRTRRVV